MINDFDRNQFSLVDFYKRRAKQILPALFFVTICCIPFAYLWMLPYQLKDFSQSIIAIVFFASNYLFWIEDGYFAPAAELKPLLHTWSLAVEEQYYLLFPLFLAVFWRIGRNRIFWIVFAIAAISLAASEFGWRYQPSKNFYLAPTRAWEILAGSICAFWLYRYEQKSKNWPSSIGLVMIVFGYICYDNTTPFPSLYTLVPVLGASLIIIYGGTGTWVAKLLSMRGFVGLGLVSYSAYLWHQPLFAFARIRSTFEPSPQLMAALAMLSLVLAFFTWRFIEKPFRESRFTWLATRRGTLTMSCAAALLLTMAGWAGHAGDGFPDRFSQNILRYEIAKNDYSGAECHLDDRMLKLSEPRSKCMRLVNNKVDLMFIGDSYMRALTDALCHEIDKTEYGYYFISKTSCISLPGFKFIDQSMLDNCNEFALNALQWA